MNHSPSVNIDHTLTFSSFANERIAIRTVNQYVVDKRDSQFFKYSSVDRHRGFLALSGNCRLIPA
jgi:hypothetical protein